MSANLQQVYVANPSTTLADDSIFYLINYPYSPTDDSGILGQDLKSQIRQGLAAAGDNFDITNLDGITQGVVTSNAVADGQFSGNYIILTAGESLSFGDVCYMKNDNRMWKASNNSASTFPAQLIAAQDMTSFSSGKFLIVGTINSSSWTWSAGGILYLDTNGQMTQTAPTNRLQVLGVAINENLIMFLQNPFGISPAISPNIREILGLNLSSTDSGYNVAMASVNTPIVASRLAVFLDANGSIYDAGLTVGTTGADVLASLDAAEARDTLDAAQKGNNSDLTSLLGLSGIDAIRFSGNASITSASSDAKTMTFNGRDIDGASDTTFITITSGNTPTCNLSDSVTKAGSYIYRAGGTDVPVTDGGTGASDATTARSNLSAAASGSNSDITSISSITGNVNNNPSLGSNLTTSGTSFTATAGENVVFGDVCYAKSDGKIWKADANAAGLFPAQYMAIGTISANATGLFIKTGFARNDSWTWTIGGILYLSTTAGAMTQTAPSATDDCVQVLGEALSATIIDFNADRTYITRV